MEEESNDQANAITADTIRFEYVFGFGFCFAKCEDMKRCWLMTDYDEAVEAHRGYFLFFFGFVFCFKLIENGFASIKF